MRIAALEDDEAQLAAISRMIADAGHACLPFTRASVLMTTLRRESFDVLVVDWNLPEMSGLELIAWVHQNLAPPPPVLLLTSRSTAADVVRGLEAGADDYVIKPFQADILMARISALVRRAAANRGTERIETFGDYVFDTTADTVRVAGDLVSLTSKEFALALLLFRNIHRPLSRAHILEAVWGRNPSLPTRTLDMHISRVRGKLELRPQRGFRLAPVYSFGYRLERLETDTCVFV
jgi:DNA-binding response OmpR family regulator